METEARDFWYPRQKMCVVRRYQPVLVLMYLVHWIVNYELEKKFEGAREILTLVTGEAPQEQHLFHGTRQANIDSCASFLHLRILASDISACSILSTGFRIGGIGSHKVINGTAFGTGVYLAATATTSMQYAPDADRMFACRGR